MAAVHQQQQPESANSVGTSGNATFAFPKSGLGTPDFFYFGGGSSAGTAGETPSWLKHPSKEAKMEEHDDAGNNTGKESKNEKSIEDGARHARALSDPPTRQSPAWLQPKNQHEHEPNPFEHSFSGKDYATMFHPPRRARSQSPKSSHGGAGGITGDINVPSSGKGFTPGSADLGNFGSMAGGNTAAHHGSTSDNMMFDPTSIRTGFTPGGIHSGLHNAGSNNYPPHSPATQALFAMMTNATPGLPALPRVESEYSGSDSADNRSNTNNKQHPLQQAAHIQPSGNSSGSGRSPESGNSGHVHAQAIPRPINVGSIYGNRPNPMAVQQASSNASSSYSGYQGSQNLLSQAAPRPMPPTAFSNNHNNLPGSQNPVPQMRGPPNPPPAGQNPLFLLSQQMQPDMPEDDTVLAAAALSGLSTPRGTYVGGPGMPTIAPGTLSNNAGKMNLQQPPSGLNPATRPAPLTKANSAAQPSIAPPASSNTVSKAGKKGAAATGGPASNKRKKTDDSAAVGGKKPKRNTRRAAAANAQPIVDADTPSEDEDDDGMSVGGSIGRSDNGRNMSYNYGNNNAGQSGSQMDMSMPGQVNRTNSGESEDKGDGPRKGGRGPKQQFETEEEKRKNFLERNRQAALKCRQRKKQWLGELQQRVENLTQDNEVLQQTCNHLREEVMSLRNILLSHKDCTVGNPPPQQQQAAGMHGQVTIGGLLSAQMQQQRQLPPAPGRSS